MPTIEKMKREASGRRRKRRSFIGKNSAEADGARRWQNLPKEQSGRSPVWQWESGELKQEAMKPGRGRVS
jgi:hypothetical protein